MSTGNIIELFSSFQGEGPYAGVRQVFVRTGGCHLRCVYCDTPESWERTAECAVEEEPATRRFRAELNPMSVDRVMEIVRGHADRWSPHSVSITGGEPLLQSTFLAGLLPGLRGLGLRTYLDTSGTLSDRLEEVIGHVDIVALDLKLPSCPGVRIDRADAKRCVEIARRAPDLFVKVVVMEDSKAEEVEEAARLVAAVDPDIAMILQPATPVNPATAAPGGDAVLRFRAAAERHLRSVSVMPQLHVLAGWK